ncbi:MULTISPECIES: ketopantoate reductase family protein [Streptacidiphilus]|uniref:Ketopantoate reductase family protein n=1 Tax=Streptacidiphilus cavernicola TaxID=3342716 RepID=A0ABV6URN6_9ACTN|nr:2-dehydropantoate 2-reductase N-terminal domain-containing protein [Streptacidiphilus jeojiense]
MRYIIIGAGAVGGAIGGRLFEGGREVVLVARGAHHRALAEKGLTLLTPDGTAVLPVPAADGPDGVDLRPDDVLLLAVKSQDTRAALDAWADRPVAGGGTAAELLPLVCAQNAVENEREALRRFRRVYGMCVWLPATHLEPGVIGAEGSPLTGILHIGRYPHGADDTARRIAADLEACKLLAPVSEDVMRWKYGKLITNLSNALEALTGPIESAQALELHQAAMAEGTRVLDAAGIGYATDQERAEVAGDRMRYRPVPGVNRGGGSSWQSLARGTGSIEADYLNGEIVLLGRVHGLATPVNGVLQRLADRAARAGRGPGSTTPAELAALIAKES